MVEQANILKTVGMVCMFFLTNIHKDESILLILTLQYIKTMLLKLPIIG